MRNQNELIKLLNKQLQELINLKSELGYVSDFGFDTIELVGHEKKKSLGKQKLLRWIDNTFKIIKKNIGSVEGKRLKDCLKSGTLKNQVIDCCSYLEILIEEVKQNSESFEGTQTDDFITNILSNMHAEVVKIARDRIQSKDYKNIILDISISLENYTKKKTTSNNTMHMSGVKLMEYVFSKNNPIIQISKKAEEQQGFMFLFSGAIKAIRNQCAHKLYNIDLQEALEILNFLSFLFRVVDKGSSKK